MSFANSDFAGHPPGLLVALIMGIWTWSPFIKHFYDAVNADGAICHACTQQIGHLPLNHINPQDFPDLPALLWLTCNLLHHRQWSWPQIFQVSPSRLASGNVVKAKTIIWYVNRFSWIMWLNFDELDTFWSQTLIHKIKNTKHFHNCEDE